MDWNRIEGNWKQLRGRIREQWGKLTDDELDVVAGKRFDTNLSKQLRKGFKVGPVIPDYAMSWGSLDWAVTILWENPEYRPVKRTWPALPIPAVQSPSPARA